MHRTALSAASRQENLEVARLILSMEADIEISLSFSLCSLRPIPSDKYVNDIGRANDQAQAVRTLDILLILYMIHPIPPTAAQTHTLIPISKVELEQDQ